MKKTTINLFSIVILITISGTITLGQIDFKQKSVPFKKVTTSSEAIDFADIDKDGDQDLFITGLSDQGKISELYLNEGNGNFTKKTNASITPVSSSAVGFEDFNNDGYPDLLISGNDTTFNPVTELYLNDGNGNFNKKSNLNIDSLSETSLDFADVNGDTNTDVVITGKKSAFTQPGEEPEFISNLYLNDGNGNFSVDNEVKLDSGASEKIAFVDANKDNNMDILFDSLYINDGNGNFTANPPPYNKSNSVLTIDFITKGDANADQDSSDILVGGAETIMGSRVPYTGLFYNEGSPDYKEQSGMIGNLKNGEAGFSDVDLDGDQDLLIFGVNDKGDKKTLMYRSDGNGNFTKVENMPFPDVFFGDLKFTDVNGDNKEDVVITGEDSAGERITQLYINKSCTINIDTSVTQQMDTLIANETGASYQWLNCDNNFSEVTGEQDYGTNRKFVPASNGSYAVEITKGDCKDTSGCHNIIITGNKKHTFAESFSVYPNPSKDVFHVSLNKVYDNINVKITSIDGKLIHESDYNNTSKLTLDLKGSFGIYYLNIITSSGKQANIPLIKK